MEDHGSSAAPIPTELPAVAMPMLEMIGAEILSIVRPYLCEEFDSVDAETVRREAARAALEAIAPMIRRKDAALNVWLCTYASDMVAPEDAENAAASLNDHGTLFFITSALEGDIDTILEGEA